ncbi:MAG: TonB-dependent receptor [Desulfobulbaceae bacterium]|nr:TonB-dependent receptor [Desulfobulbaceae bacterium]
MRFVRLFNSTVLGAFFLSLSLPFVASAAEDASERMGSLLAMNLDELINLEVTLATGSPKPLRLAPSVATVITAADIEAMGATTLDEALESVPGLHVAISNKNQMDSVYSIRGIHTSLNPQVLVLLDGLPVNYAYSGGRPFGFLMPVAMIARVEVVRGPGSAVYGADAFAGTINIVTKEHTELNGSQAGARYGSFATSDLWLQHGQRYFGWDLLLGLEYQKSHGDRGRVVERDLQSQLDAVLGTSVSLAPGSLRTGYELVNTHLELAKAGWTLRLWGWMTKDEMADGVTQTLTPGNRLDSRQYRADLSHDNKSLLPDTTFTTRLSYSYLKSDPFFQLFPAGVVLPIGGDGNINFTNPTGLTRFPDGVFGHPIGEDTVWAGEETIRYDGLAQHRWRGAVGYRDIREQDSEAKNFGPGVLDGSQEVSSGALTEVTGTAYIFMEEQKRQLAYLSLQDEWVFAQGWELTAGLRYDHYSDFGSTVNPRLALVWETLPELTSKIMYGRAFRPPSFTELYAKNNPSNLGNPNLNPETIDTYEVAFDYRPAKVFRSGLNLFAYKVKDLIELVQDPWQTTLSAQNCRDQEGRGLEVEADWLPLASLRMKSSIAYQRSWDARTKAVVADAPALQFKADLNWSFLPAWSLTGQYLWIGDRHRAATDTRPDIANYDLVNLVLRRTQIAGHWDTAVAVRNLFDADAREPSLSVIPNDYPLAGRSVWVEVGCSL